MTQGRRLGAAVVLAVLLASTAAYATTMRELTLDELAERADVVALGRVVGVGSVATVIDGRLRARTVHRVAVEETLLGRAWESELELVTEEGALLGVRISREGSVRLRRGQRVLVFATRRGAHAQVVGESQGAFVVAEPRGRGAEPRLVRAGDPGVLVGRVAGAALELGERPTLASVKTALRAMRGSR